MGEHQIIIRKLKNKTATPEEIAELGEELLEQPICFQCEEIADLKVMYIDEQDLFCQCECCKEEEDLHVIIDGKLLHLYDDESPWPTDHMINQYWDEVNAAVMEGRIEH